MRKRVCPCIILVIMLFIMGIILPVGCSSQKGDSSEATVPVTTSVGVIGSSAIPGSSLVPNSSAASETRTYPIDANVFPVEEESGSLVMTGDLTPFISVHAQVLCERDLNEPGTGSVDQAILREFYPEDLDLLIDSTWEKTSDQTESARYETGAIYDKRTMRFLSSDAKNIDLLSYFDLIYMTDNTISTNYVPERIPWDSETYPWGTEEFAFASEQDAFTTLQEMVGRLGITLSSVYTVDYITSSVLDTVTRVKLAEGGNDSVLDKSWTDADNAYRFKATQDWNGLPVNPDMNGQNVFDGENLQGEAYHVAGVSSIFFMLNAQGIPYLHIYNVYEAREKGDDVALISVWDALQALQTQLNNPKHELEILYNTSTKEQQGVIDQIKLCYLPINLATVNSENLGAGFSEGMTETDNGQPTFPFKMVPCWTFRLVGKDMFGTTSYVSCAVNAITGEYMLMTLNFPGI